MDNVSVEERSQSNNYALANYKFSSEELRVLRECSTESFLQRSLPFGTGFGLLAYFGVKRGYFQPNSKFGAVPKIILGATVGYFLGKFSYQQKCAEKLMQLPNSKLAEMIRLRRNGKLKDGLLSGFSSITTPNANDMYTDMDPNEYNVLDFDSDSRSSIMELDDLYRPSLDSSSSSYETEIPLPAAKAFTTYEELRKKNREDYINKQNNSISQSINQSINTRNEEASLESSHKTRDLNLPKNQKNKYGDTWTD
ncbi:OCIA domain-containing protein 1-like [Teleopsis dalmanni]|uniref:OCIA domain-containing protein 1-like n=1 Tax=Teleopsis dalmanni TaxID=139649 RepID=UPI0018CD347E|nr:OCIA domain-containing protein 1-like [Teleopsis dalmanni]